MDKAAEILDRRDDVHNCRGEFCNGKLFAVLCPHLLNGTTQKWSIDTFSLKKTTVRRVGARNRVQKYV
jgi:hypothetical protein